MTLRSASADAAKSRRWSAWSPRSYIATASWYVGLRTGGGAGAGGAGGGATGLTTLDAGLGADFLEPVLDADERDALTGRAARRAVRFCGGLRLELVRAFTARRNFAMPGW